MLVQPKFNIELPEKEKIVIDYGGANVAKPLHVGHLRKRFSFLSSSVTKGI